MADRVRCAWFGTWHEVVMKTGIAIAAIFVVLGMFVPPASAGIIGLQAAQTCTAALRGTLPTSASTVQNGTYCTALGLGWNLSDLLAGNIQLWIGNSSTPKYQIYNDTQAPLESLTLQFYGSLASNTFIDMQTRDAFQNWSCTSVDADGVAHTSANCGTGDIAPSPIAMPVTLTWTAGTPLAAGATFNIWTASFAHAGQDRGYFGPPPDVSVPDSASTLLLFGTVLTGLAAARRSWRR